jgi:nucleotide-binding universal stress UspA family protein
MYNNILVPLDGSTLAECVLPHVESLVKGGQTKSVTFIRVVEPVYLPGGGEFAFSHLDHQKIEAEAFAQAQEYIKKVVDQSQYTGVNIQEKVIQGKVADSLSEYAEKNNVDLIVIATHGRSGISRWVWGSVADRILRSVHVPVLMIRAPGSIPSV